MLPYYFLIIVPVILFIIGYYRKEKWDRPCIISFFTILILLLSCRSVLCGTDLLMYSGFFDRISSYTIEQTINFSKKGEVLYYLLQKAVSSLGGNFQVFLFVVALLSIMPILILYCKKSKHGLLTIALFLTVAPFTMFFSGLRQSLAMGIVVCSYRFIEDKKLFKFLLCILVAMYFHKSASIAFLLYPIYHAHINKNWIYFMIPIYITVYYYNRQIFTFFLSLYNPIYEETYGYVTSTGQYSILLLLLLFNLYCFVIPNKRKIDTEFIGLRNILLLATLFQLFVPINYMVMRMNYYFLLFIPLLISKIPSICCDKYKRITHASIIIMIVFFLLYFIYDGYTGSDVLRIFPYIPFWEA